MLNLKECVLSVPLLRSRCFAWCNEREGVGKKESEIKLGRILAQTYTNDARQFVQSVFNLLAYVAFLPLTSQAHVRSR